MDIGMLDCRVGGKWIEETERYRERGWDIITSSALDKPTKQYDILATTWTQMSEARLRAVGCRGLVIRDNDEPWNQVSKKVVDALSIKMQLIDNWGVSTRVAWNMRQIEFYAPDCESVLIVADTPSHDALAVALADAVIDFDKCPVKDLTLTWRTLNAYDAVIVHLSKADFTKHWFDQFLAQRIATKLLISTTRGPIFSAHALNHAVADHAPEVAVLDWAWQRNKFLNYLIAENKLVLTNHSSYQSEQSRHELTDVTIAAVEKLIAEL